MILQDFGPTAICCTPSYALNLAEEGKAMGIDMKTLSLADTTDFGILRLIVLPGAMLYAL